MIIVCLSNRSRGAVASRIPILWAQGVRPLPVGELRLLCDAARRHFAMAVIVPKDRFAFSQPTAAGRKLAVGYSGTESFLVYE